MVTVQADAHDTDWWNGTVPYNNNNPRNVTIQISQNALVPGVLTMDRYEMAMVRGIGWNEINGSRIHISRVSQDQWGHISVMGWRYPANSGTLGELIPRGQFGSIVGPNDNWQGVEIRMNDNNSGIWTTGDFHPGGAIVYNRVVKTFIHEVGHALKLSHPAPGNNATHIAGHTIRWDYRLGDGERFYPSAVMNTGFPDWETPTSWMRTQHDRDNAARRWPS
jgi:hypothetical protein